MKKLILFAVLQTFVLSVFMGQSLSESLGAIKTDFKLSSDTTDLNASDQIIVLGAEKRTYNSSDGGGWGYGYQSFHLEFISIKKIYTISGGTKERNNYRLTFSDKENYILAKINIPGHSFKMYTNPFIKNLSIFYSIDLIYIPALLLEKTSKIDIVKLE